MHAWPWWHCPSPGTSRIPVFPSLQRAVCASLQTGSSSHSRTESLLPGDSALAQAWYLVGCIPGREAGGCLERQVATENHS